MKKIVLITRTWCGKNANKNNYDKDLNFFIKKIHRELDRIIVLINIKEETNNHTRNLLKKSYKNIANRFEIVDVKPWGDASGAFNIGLTKAFNHEEKPDQILIASPEVNLDKNNIKTMSQELIKNPNMLVVGYTLEAYTDNDYQFKGCEKGHNLVSRYEVYKTPWNTCAMWDAKKFSKYVGTFNILCDCPKYLGTVKSIPLQGMEDTLAMALAQKNCSNLEIGIIKKPLPWKVKKERIEKHINKMKRKQLVYKEYQKIFKLNSINNIKEL